MPPNAASGSGVSLEIGSSARLNDCHQNGTQAVRSEQHSTDRVCQNPKCRDA